jgi:hypothetical protein
MPVKILILSGARQGEQLVLDAGEFRVGSDPACEVFFDPERDRAIRGRSAMFRREEDGWYIRCAGGEVLVNQQAVAGRTRVRSGDVVRMSDSGPDFSFSIVAGVSVSPLAQSAVESAAQPQPLDVPCPVAEVERTAVPQAADAEQHSVSAPMTSGKIDRRWITWAMAGLALGALALVIVRSALSPPTIIVKIDQPGIPLTPVGATTDSDARATGRESVKTGQTTSSETKKSLDTGGKVGEEKGQDADVGAQLGEAVFLLQVENSGQSWPFATCVAIHSDTLLTTAREAAQLATWREEKGFKIWVTRPATGFKEEVQDIRINGVFASLADKPDRWIYFNMGLLVIQGKLPKAAPLASPEELAKLEEGLRVDCFGFTHEGEKISRFDRFEPRLTQGKVYVISAPADLPVRSALLHVKAEIPKNAYGSPVVNAQGKVLGIYGEAAVPPTGKETAAGGAGLKNLHYVTVVNPEMLNLWLRDRDAKMWPPAAAVRTSQKTQDNP